MHSTRVLYSSQSWISNFESHLKSREALCVFKALQLRRELILLAGYLARINISKFMIADRVARFRRTAGQVYLCSLTCNGDCYLRSSATRVIVVKCRMSTETLSFAVAKSGTRRVSYPHFGESETSTSRQKSGRMIGLVGTDRIRPLDPPLSRCCSNILFFQNLTFPACLQKHNMHLEEKKIAFHFWHYEKSLLYHYPSLTCKN